MQNLPACGVGCVDVVAGGVGCVDVGVGCVDVIVFPGILKHKFVSSYNVLHRLIKQDTSISIRVL